MRRTIALAALLTAALVLPPATANAEADTTPPTATFTTQNDAILLTFPVGSDQVRGTAEDKDGSGVARVDVQFSSLLANGSGWYDCKGTTPCDWGIYLPIVPGRYTATVWATDVAGNVQATRPTITIIVI